MRCAKREPGRSWEAIERELHKLGDHTTDMVSNHSHAGHLVDRLGDAQPPQSSQEVYAQVLVEQSAKPMDGLHGQGPTDSWPCTLQASGQRAGPFP